jgi:DNA-binding NtrC family response regulator
MSLEHRIVALVEDDPIMGESLVQRLSLEGAEVHWWRNKHDALTGLLTAEPNVVICDIRLPDGNGEEIFSETRRRRSAASFLFMTAYSDIDQAVRLMKAGAADYVIKPFEMNALLNRLAKITPAAPWQKSLSNSLRDARGEAEKAEIERALSETRGHLGEAARRLDISRTTLWARMKALGIKAHSFKRSKN